MNGRRLFQWVRRLDRAAFPFWWIPLALGLLLSGLVTGEAPRSIAVADVDGEPEVSVREELARDVLVYGRRLLRGGRIERAGQVAAIARVLSPGDRVEVFFDRLRRVRRSAIERLLIEAREADRAGEDQRAMRLRASARRMGGER